MYLKQALERALHDKCLYADAGWWGYELCWARHLRQYHVPELSVEQKLESVHLLGASPLLGRCGSHQLHVWPPCRSLKVFALGST